MPIRMLDLSYGGLRLELADASGDVPDVLTLTVPTAGITVTAVRVWTARGRSGDTLWCGAELSECDTGQSSAWREFVDAVALAELVRPRLPERTPRTERNIEA